MTSSPKRRAKAGGPPAKRPAFVLGDQFGRELESSTYDGAPLIVVAGNREGAGGVALWTAALRAVIGDDGGVDVLPVADLRGVPRLVRKLVGRLLPRDPAHWCALDWDGQLGALVRGEHGPLVAASYDGAGMLRTWSVLPLETVESALMVRLVESASGG